MDSELTSRSRLNAEVLDLDELDLIGFAAFVRRRWLLILSSCGIAVALALAASLLIPKRYTATATILIEPPAGNDPRGATAISPMYLESLKTYERFATSDSLFSKALAQLHLRQRYLGVPMETLKKRVLRVSKPRDTKVLEISATLPSASDAQSLAHFLAQETVELSGALDRQSQRDLTEQVREQLAAATKRLEKAEEAREEFLTDNPIEVLETTIRNDTEQKLRLQSELAQSRIDLADSEARLASLGDDSSDTRNTGFLREQVAASKARALQIDKENRALAEILGSNGLLLERRKRERERLDSERQAARAQLELATTRHNDTLASGAFRSERLEIVDPGGIPERPSSPNIGLNVLIALLTALVGSSCFLALRFSYSRMSS